MVTGWLYNGGSWYYLTPSGAMATGHTLVDGTWRAFDGDGALL